jgi:hypothetical protein
MAGTQQGVQLYSRPSHTAWTANTALLHARDELGSGVDRLAGIVERYISRTVPQTHHGYTDCSVAAASAFEMLTGLLPDKCPGRAWLRDADDVASGLQQPTPTVRFISLTAAADPFSTADGHRFVVLGSKGRFRLLQACKDKCSLSEFALHPGFSQSWSAEEFTAWWGKMQDLERRGGAAAADEMEALLGVPYDGPLGSSVVVQSDVRLYWG